ncbi:MAG TPA: amidophosphoribosyltransferase [Defluviitoga sp.]|nr:amidophosphoribosyltransferase [Defluviitoga sp.]HOP23972.1 amidophosphoribosyltransferase [Defluviitoga sp.]HPZ28907.1 amidophosphoribosyltransferase [Defluviitoga sp.]HQD62293.1 amidophosphoribosyltransferase [Defluviitoga sp.]
MLNENCGLFAVYHKDSSFNVSAQIIEGLIALQHRGQESAGIAVSNGENIQTYKGMGVVNDVFPKEVIKRIKGSFGIGHVKYSTNGFSNYANAEPLTVKYKGEFFSVAHNGQIENSAFLRDLFEEKGTIFFTTSDTELIPHLLVTNLKGAPSTWDPENIAKLIDKHISPSYSLLLLFKNKIIALRDRYGYRPLAICETDDAVYLASEDSAFKFFKLNNSKIREVEPGEMIEINSEGLKSYKINKNNKYRYCFFEHIYFARPDSNIYGDNVHLMREKLGELTAKEHPVEADIIVPVMDSGFSAALGYSKASGIPLELGLMRNKYIGRTFIDPDIQERKLSVRRKLSPVKEVIENKDIVLIDDSMVRGTTMKHIVKMLKENGAKKVHIRIASPMVVNTCYWGIDIPDKKDIIGANKSKEDIKRIVNADSLEFLSLQYLSNYLDVKVANYCFHCFQT